MISDTDAHQLATKLLNTATRCQCTAKLFHRVKTSPLDVVERTSCDDEDTDVVDVIMSLPSDICSKITLAVGTSVLSHLATLNRDNTDAIAAATQSFCKLASADENSNGYLSKASVSEWRYQCIRISDEVLV